ncbi:MAG: hypothetical protein ABI577_10220 [bacterium]
MQKVVAVGLPETAVIRSTTMNYLKAVPRTDEAEAPSRAVAVVSPDAREVVYLDETASLEIITEALKAWGLRVRSERSEQAAEVAPPQRPTPADGDWRTTRSEHRAPGRLDNILSPLWLPIQHSDPGNEPVAAWSWFGRAA